MHLRDTSLPVLVLPMDHYGSLGVMRSLGRLGVRVYGAHPSRQSPASFSTYCQKTFQLDIDGRTEAQSVEQLEHIAKEIGGNPLLIATNDEAALFVARNSSQLQQHFLFSRNSSDVVCSLYNKRQMYNLAKHLAIPTAETIFPKSRKDVLEFAEKASFPVMLKASDNIAVSRRSGRKMVIIESPDELIRQYDAMEDLCDPTLMLQEYIPGKDDSVWMFNGYFDQRSECLFGVTGKKIHQSPVYTGMTALGVCLPNPEIVGLTRALVKAIGYTGILDIGYRYDARDSSYKLLDANPRLGATFRLFVDSNEMDVARAAYCHFSDQPINNGSLCAGRKWIVEDSDLRSCIRYYQDGVLTLPEWITGYAGIQECAWFATDDMMPFLQLVWKLSRRAWQKIFREGGSLLDSPSKAMVRNANTL